MPTLAAAGLDSNLETPEHDPDTPQNDQTSATYLPQLHFDRDPTLKYCFQAQFAAVDSAKCPNSNFLKGVKWSPDGACFLTGSDDNRLHIFDLPTEAYTNDAPNAETVPVAGQDSFDAALQVQEGELVYDYAWYSRMHTSDPVSCCFATTARAHPIHLWDACSGSLRCVYRAYDAADEVIAAFSLAIDPSGSHIWAGYNKAIRVFDLTRPGREYQTITTAQKGQEGLPGIVACMDFSPSDSNMLAAGSYSSSAAVYDVASGTAAYILSGHKGGITQVKFSADGNFLYTGARKDPDILCWDVRYTSDVVYRLQRQTADTNQRIQFDIEPMGRHLTTGGTDGQLLTFDLTTGAQVSAFQACSDTLNGMNFHPYLALAATASGERRFPAVSDDEDISEPQTGLQPQDLPASVHNALQVWHFSADWMQLAGDGASSSDKARATGMS